MHLDLRMHTSHTWARQDPNLSIEYCLVRLSSVVIQPLSVDGKILAHSQMCNGSASTLELVSVNVSSEHGFSFWCTNKMIYDQLKFEGHAVYTPLSLVEIFSSKLVLLVQKQEISHIHLTTATMLIVMSVSRADVF